MRKLAAFVIAVLMLSLACMAANDPIATSGSSDLPKVETFFGYSFSHANNGLSGTQQSFLGLNTGMNTNGWDLGATYRVNRYLGGTAELNGNYAGDFFGVNAPLEGSAIKFSSHTYNLLLGPTFTYRNKSRVTPFAHTLLGVSRATASISNTVTSSLSGGDTQYAFATAIGGGVDYKFNKRLSARLFQFDYLYSRQNFETFARFINPTSPAGFPTSENHFRYSAGIVLKTF